MLHQPLFSRAFVCLPEGPSAALTVPLLLLSILLPGGSTAEEPARSKPDMWLAARSLDRLEGRLREASDLVHVPGLHTLAVGAVAGITAGLEGLDRERPIALGFTGADPMDLLMPDLASPDARLLAVIPYSDEERILATLGRLLRSEVRRDGDSIAVDPPVIGPIGGRLDRDSSTLVLSPTPEWLAGIDARVPPNLFPSIAGPDVVLRVDLSKLPLEGRGDAREPEPIEQEIPEAVRRLVEAFLGSWLRRGDWEGWSGEACLTLAPAAWSIELGVRGPVDSPKAKRFAEQVGRPSRAALLARDAYCAGAVGIRITERLRSLVTVERQSLGDAIDRIGEAAGVPEAERSRRREFALALVETVAPLFAEESLELGFEGDAGSPGLAAWVPVLDGAGLPARIAKLSALAVRLWPEEVLLSPGGEEDLGGTRALRFRVKTGPFLRKLGIAKGGTDSEGEVFLAEDSGFLVMRWDSGGGAVLRSLLDRARAQAGKTPLRSDALVRIAARLPPTGLSVGPDEFIRAVLEILVRADGASLRIALPRDTVKALSRHFGTRIWDALKEIPCPK
jgi:hypothetical protein